MPAHQVSLCGEVHSDVQHVCAFFDSRDAQYDVLTPYYREGVEAGERVLNILERAKHEDHKQRLRSAGIPVEDLERKGQFQLCASDDTYTRGGIFAAERMLSLLEQALAEAASHGYSSIRADGDMEWALENLPGTDELMVYEARINLLAPKHNCTIICSYDINRFSGSAISDILATHPHVIMNGRMHKNPEYVEPITLLKQLLNRKKRGLARDQPSAN